MYALVTIAVKLRPDDEDAPDLCAQSIAEDIAACYVQYSNDVTNDDVSIRSSTVEK